MGGRRLDQPLTTDSYLNDVLRRSRERTQSLGDICKFDIMGIEIAPDALFKILSDLSLAQWTPVPIRKKTAARKAITRVRNTLEDPSNDLKVIVRKVPTAEQNIVRYAIIDETIDGTGLDLDYSTRNQVVFHTDNGTMEFTKEVNHEILKAYDYLCSVYTDCEIKHMVKNIVHNHGCVWLRDKSGMFFMPHPMKNTVDALVELFDTLSGLTTSTCYFRPIAILDDEQNRAAMGEALIADITVELGEATRHLDKAIENDSKTSLNAAIKQFKIAKGKASIYKDMLQINVDDITQQLSDANTKAAALLTTFALQDANKKAKGNG